MAYSWQARRNYLDGVFTPLDQQLGDHRCPYGPGAPTTQHGPGPVSSGRGRLGARSSATRDRLGRPGAARPIAAIDLVWRWTLQAPLSERLRELGDALAADEDLCDDSEGVGVPHWELRAEEHLLIGLPAEQPVPDCPNVHLGPPTGGRSTIDTTSIGAEVA
jgi:hypothetical protein